MEQHHQLAHRGRITGQIDAVIAAAERLDFLSQAPVPCHAGYADPIAAVDKIPRERAEVFQRPGPDGQESAA